LSQKDFTAELLKDNNINNSKTATTPLPLYCKLDTKEGDLLSGHYKAMVGKLNFLAHTRQH